MEHTKTQDLSARPPDLSQEEEREELRAQDAELKEEFQKRGNLFALHTAIRVSYTLPVAPALAPFDVGEQDMYFVPYWVLDACYELATQAIGHASTGRGRHAKWFNRYIGALKDDGRWDIVHWCSTQGLNVEDAIHGASLYLNEPEDTIAKAYRRVERRRKRGEPPAFRPVAQYWQDEDPSNHPIFHRAYQVGRIEFFSEFMEMMRSRVARGKRSRHKEDDVSRAEGLLEFVEKSLARSRPRRTR